MLAGNPVLRRQLFNDRRFNTGLSLTALMLGYFCLSTLWSAQPKDLISELTHALYLLLFIAMYRSMALQGLRSIALWAVAAGMMVLVALTFFTVNIQTILNNRLTDGFFGAPTNVIDLAGYFALGILMCLIIMRDTGALALFAGHRAIAGPLAYPKLRPFAVVALRAGRSVDFTIVCA
ncbi:MAG: hypothetical protein ACMX3H_16770 [Sodalis sp. (in: enterobacteria)]|uniref:hypothetical protein n=1 Tax=Sodalis sp. (in: enterobacteria) TaxID=1898979 RepID=UPI0039E4490B